MDHVPCGFSDQGMTLLRQMFFLKPGIYDLSMFVTHKTTVCMMVGFLICGPVQKMLPGLARHMLDEDSVSLTESMGLSCCLPIVWPWLWEVHIIRLYTSDSRKGAPDE